MTKRVALSIAIAMLFSSVALGGAPNEQPVRGLSR